MPYGAQTLWTDHCIQNSSGAEFHPDLNTSAAQAIIRKGYRREIDSYSAFFENDGETKTGLQGWLATKQISSVYLVGLATDYCVAYSALDAARLGFDVTVLLPACRGIDLDGSLSLQLDKMLQAGITLLEKLPE
jgi:nicotinamidase/pyrazinamidase